MALRATVLELRAQLDTARVASAASAAAAATAAGTAPPARELRFVTLNLPMVQAALASPELASTAAAAAASARMARAATIELDLTADSAQTEIVLADLPEAALLDPRRDRSGDPVEDPASLRAAHKVAAGKHARLEAPLRRTA